MAKLRGPSALSPRQRGFAVAALAAMLAPAMIVGTKLVDWVNLSKHQDINVALGQADVYGALRYDPAELGASGRLPLSEELSAALIADLQDGDIDDDLDNDPGLIDDFPAEHGIPGVVLEAYLRAEDKMAELVPGCHLDWALLAGIGKIESNHANNGRLNAVGDAVPKILGPVLNGSPGVAAIRDTDGGRLDGDNGDQIFPKAFDLAAWWSSLFEIPAVVMGGRTIESVVAAAEAGIEFVALRSAVWDYPQGPAAAVAEANRLLTVTEPA